jgi:hypothetical protein
MNNAPQNYEFKQQLAALSLHDQLSILAVIRQRIKRARRLWQFDYIAPWQWVMG